MQTLELRSVQKSFGTTVAVADSNLTIAPGEFVSFLGPSGCGKTTTLRMIAGFEEPTAGQILLGGNDITHTPIHKRHIGMVFQSYALFPTMTVAENIGFGVKIAGADKHTVAARVADMLALIDMQNFATRYPHQLSGGQQQRVALARALANNPTMLLLDEPLSALDAKIRESLRREIRDIQQKLGITTVYVTHDQQEALTLSDRIVVMSQGRIEQIGTPAEIYRSPANPFVASFVGQVNLFEATVLSRTSVEYAGIEWDVALPVNAPIGSVVHCYVRPEGVSIRMGMNDGIEAVVERVEYLGMTTRTTLRVGSRMLVSEYVQGSETVHVTAGMTVTVLFTQKSVGCFG